MGNSEKTLRELNLIWLSFIGFLLFYTVIVWVVHPFPLTLKPYVDTFSSFSSIPDTTKILLFIGIGEFIFVAGRKNAFNKVFPNMETKPKFLIAWAFGESIALYGLVGAFITKNGTYYPPLLILSLIALFVWKPKKSEIEGENREQPISFE